MKTLKRITLPVALIAMLFATGCIGPFNAVGRVHTWNREFDSRWSGEGVYLVFRILPVYGLCFLGDALIFNSIEFWGGTNPIDPVDPARRKALAEADAARASG